MREEALLEPNKIANLSLPKIVPKIQLPVITNKKDTHEENTSSNGNEFTIPLMQLSDVIVRKIETGELLASPSVIDTIALDLARHGRTSELEKFIRNMRTLCTLHKMLFLNF